MRERLKKGPGRCREEILLNPQTDERTGASGGGALEYSAGYKEGGKQGWGKNRKMVDSVLDRLKLIPNRVFFEEKFGDFYLDWRFIVGRWWWCLLWSAWWWWW